MRLGPQPGERIDRARPLQFTFAGERFAGFAGDSIASALFATGRRVFSRSFKYHRPRGLQCCTGSCANCLMTVDGVPNVRVCVEPLRTGADVRAQNVLGSLDRDLLAVVDRAGGPFTPVGFYYRTMIRPRRLWPVYERVLRQLAGLGRVDGRAAGHGRHDVEHRRVDVARRRRWAFRTRGGRGGGRGRRPRAARRTTANWSPESGRTTCSHPRMHSASTRAGSSRSTPAPSSIGSARAGSWSRRARSSSRSSSPATTSSA